MTDISPSSHENSQTASLRAPIKLRASLHTTIWGGRRLATLAGKAIPEDALIGESWETALDAIAENAPYEGETLGALTERYGEALIGSRAVAVFGERFPLLTKFIDAHQWLSVQVHPDDAYANEHEGGKLGKTETWYILHAEPGAQIVYGVKRPVTRDEVRQAIEETRLETLLNHVEARAGDVIFVPAGTVHAIGAGVALYELQEYSDITYRLYDYGRLQANGQPRELHVERALDVMRTTPHAVVHVRPITCGAPSDGYMRRTLVGCRYFVMDELTLDGLAKAAIGEVTPASCQIVTVLEGAAEIAGQTEDGVRLGVGETAVLPATMGAWRIHSTGNEQARIMRSYVPTESDPALLAWQAAQPVQAG